ncbi:hypothetical protein HDU76_009369 [Blyttiomyces sp. JEL0837]|nr:hypothetical protein HDU76_009369 [Blyttiomyces sp. JEL0837]
MEKTCQKRPTEPPKKKSFEELFEELKQLAKDIQYIATELQFNEDKVGEALLNDMYKELFDLEKTLNVLFETRLKSLYMENEDQPAFIPPPSPQAINSVDGSSMDLQVSTADLLYATLRSIRAPFTWLR